jgi:hypothetical protein
LSDELDGVAGLDVLGQQHDAEVGVAGAQLAGGAGAVVRATGWHPDVDDGEVRPERIDGGDGGVGVGDLGDHVVAGVGHQPR